MWANPSFTPMLRSTQAQRDVLRNMCEASEHVEHIECLGDCGPSRCLRIAQYYYVTAKDYASALKMLKIDCARLNFDACRFIMAVPEYKDLKAWANCHIGRYSREETKHCGSQVGGISAQAQSEANKLFQIIKDPDKYIVDP